MCDYMRTLHQLFTTLPEHELSRKFEQTHAELHDKLDCQAQKLLLRICDLQDAIRDEVSLHRFISGYRLAEGISRELAAQPVYSFDRAEETHGKATAMREEG